MAEENDDSQKTEEPTHKRLEDARRKGQVANSREVNHWFMILGAAVVVVAVGPLAAERVAALLRPFLEQPHAVVFAPDGIPAIQALVPGIALVLAVPLALLTVVALAAGFIQNGLLVSAESLKPKLSKISPIAGLKRLFSAKSLAEFVKGLLKLVVVGAVAALLMIPSFGDIDLFVQLDALAQLTLIYDLTVRMLVGVAAVMAVIAGLDFLYQRWEHMKGLRMSRQELKEEHKEQDGDPQIKARLRQLRMERSRRRMMAAVPKADVVIANPTHYAVALSYEAARMNAPRVVAKGVDQVALRIRQVAAEHGVPVVENPPLARALHAAVDLDREIPSEHYKAVAEIIGYVMKLQRKVVRA